MTDATAPTLFEWSEERAELDAVLAGASEGRGRTALIAGPAGIGKTALLHQASSTAARRGLVVLAARGGELEQDFAFGVVRQLVEPHVSRATPEQRRRLLAGAAALAERAFTPAAVGGYGQADSPDAVLHGLYWLVANLARTALVLVAVDGSDARLVVHNTDAFPPRHRDPGTRGGRRAGDVRLDSGGRSVGGCDGHVRGVLHAAQRPRRRRAERGRHGRAARRAVARAPGQQRGWESEMAVGVTRSTAVVLPVPVEEAWAVLSDTTRMVALDPLIDRYEPERGTIEAGTLNRMRGRVGPFPVRLVTRTEVVEPPRRAVFVSVTPSVPVQVRVEDTLESAEGGCRLQVTVAVTPTMPVIDPKRAIGPRNDGCGRRSAPRRGSSGWRCPGSG